MQLNAQLRKTDVCISLNEAYSTNGHGAYTTIGASFISGKKELEFLFSAQNTPFNFTGFETTYKNVLYTNWPINFFVLGTLSGNFFSPLETSLHEEIINANLLKIPNLSIDSKLKFTTVNAYFGGGTKIILYNNLSIDTGFGLGGYFSFKTADSVQDINYGRYRPDSGIGVYAKIGLQYRVYTPKIKKPKRL
ncbi:MAG TPA: hypothetical protein DCQ31_17545 [Bacteroidales bacterium]|nr:hypothetical protein [Bacteroidales bacterium]